MVLGMFYLYLLFFNDYFRVGYQLNDETIIFHTSCSKAQNLSVDEFHENLQESLVEMSQLFD